LAIHLTSLARFAGSRLRLLVGPSVFLGKGQNPAGYDVVIVRLMCRQSTKLKHFRFSETVDIFRNK
jgi:hypothetical protein